MERPTSSAPNTYGCAEAGDPCCRAGCVRRGISNFIAEHLTTFLDHATARSPRPKLS
jgi:hypothetical protein